MWETWHKQRYPITSTIAIWNFKLKIFILPIWKNFFLYTKQNMHFLSLILKYVCMAFRKCNLTWAENVFNVDILKVTAAILFVYQPRALSTLDPVKIFYFRKLLAYLSRWKTMYILVWVLSFLWPFSKWSEIRKYSPRQSCPLSPNIAYTPVLTYTPLCVQTQGDEQSHNQPQQQRKDLKTQ